MKIECLSVIGLGYVGLPVAVAFASKFKVIAFDINQKRITELKQGKDRTGEVETELLLNDNLVFTHNVEDLKNAKFHIIAVPTPVNEHNNPDLSYMLSASRTVGSVLKKGDIVVYESTVYPGACEEECLPILEKTSGLTSLRDFKIGYSPERINPGDKEHTFRKICKIVSGQDQESLEVIADVYGSVVDAGVYKASSIKVAEAAKVIENTQRDLNIALVNELAIIFDKLKIDTMEVLKAAGTKWNFLKFYPGLVGGHCIGVDPYYLTFKAESIGYHPQVILSGRRVNDDMAKYVAEKCIKEMIQAGFPIKNSVVTVFGLTFKEDVPDLRNSKVKNIISELLEYGAEVQVFDPIADNHEVFEEMGIMPKKMHELKRAHAVVYTVKHKQFMEITPGNFSKFLENSGVVIDVKSIFDKNEVLKNGYRYWKL
jgi:UDP-N-acetyl-D-galactosamine dehydrogenase